MRNAPQALLPYGTQRMYKVTLQHTRVQHLCLQTPMLPCIKRVQPRRQGSTLPDVT